MAQQAVVLILGLLFLTATARADEVAAVKAVKRLGGKVTVDNQAPGKPVVEVDLYARGGRDAVLKELAAGGGERHGVNPSPSPF